MDPITAVCVIVGIYCAAIVAIVYLTVKDNKNTQSRGYQPIDRSGTTSTKQPPRTP